MAAAHRQQNPAPQAGEQVDSSAASRRIRPAGSLAPVCLASRRSARLQALQAALNKKSGENRKSPEQIDAAIRQLVSKAITTEGEIIDPECRDSAPKVRNVIAQGEALGLLAHDRRAL